MNFGESKCPCRCFGDTEFQKIADLKDVGLTIFRFAQPVTDENGQKIFLNIINPANDVFILHNNNDHDISSAVFMPALEKYEKSCLRCSHVVEQMHKLLPSVPVIEKRGIRAVCEQCNTRPWSYTCLQCRETVRKFIAVSGNAGEKLHCEKEPKARIDTWTEKVQSYLQIIGTNKKELKILIDVFPQRSLEIDQTVQNTHKGVPSYLRDSINMPQSCNFKSRSFENLENGTKKLRSLVSSSKKYPSVESLLATFSSNLIDDQKTFRVVFPKTKKERVSELKQLSSYTLIKGMLDNNGENSLKENLPLKSPKENILRENIRITNKKQNFKIEENVKIRQSSKYGNFIVPGDINTTDYKVADTYTRDKGIGSIAQNDLELLNVDHKNVTFQPKKRQRDKNGGGKNEDNKCTLKKVKQEVERLQKGFNQKGTENDIKQEQRHSENDKHANEQFKQALNEKGKTIYNGQENHYLREEENKEKPKKYIGVKKYFEMEKKHSREDKHYKQQIKGHEKKENDSESEKGHLQGEKKQPIKSLLVNGNLQGKLKNQKYVEDKNDLLNHKKQDGTQKSISQHKKIDLGNDTQVNGIKRTNFREAIQYQQGHRAKQGLKDRDVSQVDSQDKAKRKKQINYEINHDSPKNKAGETRSDKLIYSTKVDNYKKMYEKNSQVKEKENPIEENKGKELQKTLEKNGCKVEIVMQTVVQNNRAGNDRNTKKMQVISSQGKNLVSNSKSDKEIKRTEAVRQSNLTEDKEKQKNESITLKFVSKEMDEYKKERTSKSLLSNKNKNCEKNVTNDKQKALKEEEQFLTQQQSSEKSRTPKESEVSVTKENQIEAKGKIKDQEETKKNKKTISNIIESDKSGKEKIFNARRTKSIEQNTIGFDVTGKKQFSPAEKNQMQILKTLLKQDLGDRRQMPETANKIPMNIIEKMPIVVKHIPHNVDAFDCIICDDSDLNLDLDSWKEKKEKKIGEYKFINTIKILKTKHPSKLSNLKKNVQVEEPLLFKSDFLAQTNGKMQDVILQHSDKDINQDSKKTIKNLQNSCGKGIIKYALSDHKFIDKGWTVLPVEKIFRKMNVYRMRPAHPEFDWFAHNKHKGLMQYDTGEKLAQFDDNGRGRWYYRNGRVALDYYDSEDLNAKQRLTIYSSGELDARGRSYPITVLAYFDYNGNGIVFDHGGKIRLKYSQSEGVVLDRQIGPVSHWKWHSLNDPPVLQKVMINTNLEHKDPHIMNLGGSSNDKKRIEPEDILAAEEENHIKERNKKLTLKLTPYQIKMKALKVNVQFSIKILDQENIYIIFRDGSTHLKLNIGMILDNKDIVDIATVESGEIYNMMEQNPAKTSSIEDLQRYVQNARRVEQIRVEQCLRRVGAPAPNDSTHRFTAVLSRPFRQPLSAMPSTTAVFPTESCTTAAMPSESSTTAAFHTESCTTAAMLSE